MKAKYKFPISGEIKLDPSHMIPVKAHGYVYEFIIDDRCVITHIEVTVPVEEQWYPKFVNTGPNRHQFITDSHILNLVQKNLRGVEALMSVWGLKYIDKRNFEINWLPETEEEEGKLHVKEFSAKFERMSIEDTPALSFDLAARAIIKSRDGAKESVVSNFYRKGEVDMENQEFIDAIYDFYFILESRFGDGKWRGDQIKQKLKCSDKLKEAFSHAEAESIPELLNTGLLAKRSKNKAYKSYDDFIDYIVDLRGKLHHHSGKNSKAWDPNKPEDYELEAIYLHAICNYLIFHITWKHIDEESVRRDYENQRSEFLRKDA